MLTLQNTSLCTHCIWLTSLREISWGAFSGGIGQSDLKPQWCCRCMGALAWRMARWLYARIRDELFLDRALETEPLLWEDWERTCKRWQLKSASLHMYIYICVVCELSVIHVLLSVVGCACVVWADLCNGSTCFTLTIIVGSILESWKCVVHCQHYCQAH